MTGVIGGSGTRGVWSVGQPDMTGVIGGSGTRGVWSVGQPGSRLWPSVEADPGLCLAVRHSVIRLAVAVTEAVHWTLR